MQLVELREVLRILVCVGLRVRGGQAFPHHTLCRVKRSVFDVWCWCLLFGFGFGVWSVGVRVGGLRVLRPPSLVKKITIRLPGGSRGGV